MLIVQDPSTAAKILSYYDNPESAGWQDEIKRLNLNLLANVAKVKSWTINDFVSDDRWIGFRPEMNDILPSVQIKVPLREGQYFLPKLDVLRSIKVSSVTAIDSLQLKANDLIWLNAHPRKSSFTMNLGTGMVGSLLHYTQIMMNIESFTKPDYIEALYTFIPPRILKEMKKRKQIICPIDNIDYYLMNGTIETL